MSLESLKHKKVFDIKTSKHLYYYTTTGIDITFDDGTVLHISAHGQGDIHTDIRKGDPPQKKKLPWRENEKKFLAKLSEDDKQEYLKARKAFFWLLDNARKVEERYSYFDKNWREKRTSFSMQIDMNANDPEDLLTIFFSSSVAPECDDWFALGKKRDWKRILEMYDEVISGKNKDNG
jgi:hypothetical protein